MSKYLSLITFLLTLMICTALVETSLKKLVTIFEIFSSMKNSITTLNKERPYKRVYTNFDEENLIKDIEKLNLTENILKINDLNKKYTFHDNVMQVVNKNIPLKELSNKEIQRKKKHWITKRIITSIHKRKSYLRKFRKADNQLFFIRYKC